jgi:putative iron-regulated protein
MAAALISILFAIPHRLRWPPYGVATHYAKLVHANYQDTLSGAQALQQSIRRSPQHHRHDIRCGPQCMAEGARVLARPKAFRFYGGPIDNDDGPEGRINIQPMSHVDSVNGKRKPPG